MASICLHIRLILSAVLLTFVVAAVSPAAAQGGGAAVNPTARSVQEDQLLREMQRIDGRCTLPDQKACLLEQPQGRDWRAFSQVTLPWIAAIAILGVLGALVVFYLIRGMVKIEGGRSGRILVRFNGFERFVHWMSAVCFIVLAISGLNITFGRSLLLPLLGPETFTVWSQWAKYAHNYLSFPFTIGVVLILLMWIGGNLPSRLDVEWVKRGGGIVGDDHPPARRFNAGQKMIYWIVVLGGGAVAVTGYILMFPFYGGVGVSGMQTAQIVHGVVSALFVAAMLGHIYIGTIGMEGAFEAMGSGTVDEQWAEQHHSLWLAEEKAKGHVEPAAGTNDRGRMQPAE